MKGSLLFLILNNYFDITFALAGIQLLRSRFDKVGVIGHSEGGTIALMLAAEQKADFIVSIPTLRKPFPQRS